MAKVYQESEPTGFLGNLGPHRHCRNEAIPIRLRRAPKACTVALSARADGRGDFAWAEAGRAFSGDDLLAGGGWAFAFYRVRERDPALPVQIEVTVHVVEDLAISRINVLEDE